MLDALVGRKQPERKRHQPAANAELILVLIGIDERRVGDAVRDQVDLGLRHAVDSPQERPGPLGHDDDAGGQGGQFLQDPPLIDVRLAQDGVEGRDDRHPQVAAKTAANRLR